MAGRPLDALCSYVCQEAAEASYEPGTANGSCDQISREPVPSIQSLSLSDMCQTKQERKQPNK